MDRNAFRLWLKPDPAGIETYAQWHLHPFPELYDLIRAAGIRRYTIWLDGADLLLTREAEDLTKGETLDMSNPVHKEWADTMTPLFDERVRGGPGKPTEIFVLDPHGEPGPAQMTYRTGLRPGGRRDRRGHGCSQRGPRRRHRRAPRGRDPPPVDLGGGRRRVDLP